MSIYTIILVLSLTLVSAQNIPIITGYTNVRRLNGTDQLAPEAEPKDQDDEQNDDEELKEPETQEEAEKRIIAAAKENGKKLPVSLNPKT